MVDPLTTYWHKIKGKLYFKKQNDKSDMETKC